MAHDEMECICGEVLVTEEQITREERAAGVKETGHLYRQYQEHMARPDHQNSPAQWKVAADRIAAWKEAAKSAKTTEK